LYAAGTMAAALAGFVSYFWHSFKADRFTAETISDLASRAVFVSLFMYITSIFVRNYRANRNLAVVNEHRKNALETFQVFANAATDPTVRAAVLMEATKCIFAPTATGFGGPEEDITPAKLAELGRGFTAPRP